MKTRIIIATVICFFLQWLVNPTYGQNSKWTIQKCIDYAQQKNIQVQKTLLSTESNKINFNATKASRFPIVDASARQSFGWADKQSTGSNSYTFSGSNSSTYSISSSVTLYAGLKLQQSIKQSDINYKAGVYDSETMKETISLNIMDAFLQILYAEEQVKNYKNQVDLTEKELNLASERLKLSAISNSDYLQVKSQLATEKQNLANAQGLLSTNRVNLMQLMELPITNDFEIEHPDLTNLINKSRKSLPDSVYQIALALKPQIKSATLRSESSALDVAIAKADYMPRVSLDAGFSSDYMSALKGSSYSFQLSHNFSPTIGLGISIPIYHNDQIKSKIELAKISTQSAQLDELNTKNQLRKSIENACTNVITAQNEYDASKEQYQANQESFAVASEKYTQELMNSVDFLVQKTNLITSESNYLQAKYNLIFSYKTLDFYLGIPFNF
ncbi:MAG: TolC family protein [Bacteroidetes bacterium]|nr:TolC family protein [Bacteroidota bacterium]